MESDRGSHRDVLAWSLPSAVSIMLERLCPRLIPRTTALEGRSTRDPLDGGATAVTSGGGVLFSEGGAVGDAREDSLNDVTTSGAG